MKLKEKKKKQKSSKKDKAVPDSVHQTTVSSLSAQDIPGPGDDDDMPEPVFQPIQTSTAAPAPGSSLPVQRKHLPVLLVKSPVLHPCSLKAPFIPVRELHLLVRELHLPVRVNGHLIHLLLQFLVLLVPVPLMGFQTLVTGTCLFKIFLIMNCPVMRIL